MYYCSGGKIAYFGPEGDEAPLFQNSFEYQRLLYIYEVVRRAVRSMQFTEDCAPGIPDSHYLEERFFGKGHQLFREKRDMESIPDVTLIGKHHLISIDFCRVDASAPIIRNGRHHGTKYQRFLGMHKREYADWSEDDFELRLKEEGITFSTDNLARNIWRAVELKNKKVLQYKCALAEYIDQADMQKPFEVWIAIEDLSPTSCSSTVLGVMRKLASSNLDIAGVIYIHHIGVDKLPNTMEDIRFFGFQAG